MAIKDMGPSTKVTQSDLKIFFVFYHNYIYIHTTVKTKVCITYFLNQAHAWCVCVCVCVCPEGEGSYIA